MDCGDPSEEAAFETYAADNDASAPPATPTNNVPQSNWDLMCMVFAVLDLDKLLNQKISEESIRRINRVATSFHALIGRNQASETKYYINFICRENQSDI